MLPSTNRLFFYGHLITWGEIQIDLYYKVMMQTKARVSDVPSSACPAVGGPRSKRWPQTYCFSVCPSCNPTDLVSFLWIDECRVLVCSGALLHKKITLRRWSCCCCRRREQLLLCIKNKLVFMTDTRWLSYLIKIHAGDDLKQPYLHILTLGSLHRGVVFSFLAYKMGFWGLRLTNHTEVLLLAPLFQLCTLWMMHSSYHPQLTGAAVLI